MSTALERVLLEIVQRRDPSRRWVVQRVTGPDQSRKEITARPDSTEKGTPRADLRPSGK